MNSRYIWMEFKNPKGPISHQSVASPPQKTEIALNQQLDESDRGPMALLPLPDYSPVMKSLVLREPMFLLHMVIKSGHIFLILYIY